MFRRGRTAALALVACALAPAAASAQAPPQVVGPYDGQVPFRCEIQDVGTGTDFPDPGADPFCVEFDKTNQNVTGFGIVDFTAQEPARVAAAGSKCFYFQRDHWTGSVVQDQQPELWHWDGNYFYDRARGVGGVSVRNLRLGGTPQDATPYVPAAYRPYFDPDGGGGVEVTLESDPDPTCIAKVDTPAERDRVYGDRGLYPECVPPGGKLHGRHVGPVHLGMSRDRVRSRLGPPQQGSRRVDRWCLIGKGELRVAYGRGGARAILTSSRGQGFRGVARGDRLRRAQRRLEIRDSRRTRHHTRLLRVAGSGGPEVWLGAMHHRVRWVMIQRGGGLRATTITRLIRHVR